MKKTVIKLASALLFIAISSMSFSQSQEENHKMFTFHNLLAKKHAKEMSSGKLNTKETNEKHTSAISKSINDAKKAFEQLKKGVAPKHKAESKPHEEAIHKDFAEVSTRLKELQEELKKINPDPLKIKGLAKKIEESMDKTEKEHQEMKKVE